MYINRGLSREGHSLGYQAYMNKVTFATRIVNTEEKRESANPTERLV